MTATRMSKNKRFNSSAFHTFLYISLIPFLCDCEVKMPNFVFNEEHKEQQ